MIEWRYGKKGNEEVVPKRRNRQTIERNRTIVHGNEKLQMKRKKADKFSIILGGFRRQLPHNFPPYSTVHSFYRRAIKRGLWEKILEHLVKKTRVNAGRKEEPSYGIIDSQSVKTVTYGDERGIDGGKNER